MRGVTESLRTACARPWIVAGLLLVLGGACGAQAQAPKVVAAQPAATPSARRALRPPQVYIAPSPEKLQPVALRDVSIDIRLEGFVASTTLDLTFANPNPRVLEGEFVLPLAPGQTITGYALEVNGALRQGVVVEKETARVAFEATERRGIDPGLAELTKGNVFRTRLYPIPANGAKRVVISFDQTLADAGANWRYVLPMAFTDKLAHFKVHAEVIRAEHTPQAAGSQLQFDRWHQSDIADLERSDYQPDQELAFTIAKPAVPATVFAVPDVLDPAWRTFAAQIDATRPAGTAGAAPIRRIALFWDASGSAQARDRARELDALCGWLATLGDVDVQLTAFRNDADPVQRFALRHGDPGELRKAIEALPLDGGSSYGAVRVDAASAPDMVIVVGDALSNFAEREPQIATGAATPPRVAFLHAAASVDSTRLARWARRFGAQDIDLLQLSRDEAIAALPRAPWLLRETRVIQGECTDLAPAAPTPATATSSVYGRCKGNAQLALTFGDATGATLTRTLSIGDGALLTPERGAFVARLWATARIADLEQAERVDDAAIVALAKRHGVVTRNTSMLVLDRIEDYVHYRVEPREADLRAQYEALLAGEVKQPASDTQQQLHRRQVLNQWLAFKQYHDERHPWLETLLQPTAQAEAQHWQWLAEETKTDVAAKLREATRLRGDADALQKRWLSDGADEARRAAWEREATRLMLAIDALHQQRLTLAPKSDEQQRSQRDAYAAATVNGGAPAADVRRQDRAATVASAPPPPPPPATVAPMEAQRTVSEAMADAPARMRQAGAVNAKKSIGGDAAPAMPESRIALQDWQADTPYLDALRKAQDPYAAYLEARASHATSPSFYLDCADYFRRDVKNARLALRVLSNLAEIDIDNAALTRVLAYRLVQWERFELAVPLFEEALALRGEEPQSYRDLALALSRQPSPDFARAADLLRQVADRNWDTRFPEIETIALHELGDVLARAPAAQRDALRVTLIDQGLDARLLEPVPVALRVVLTWDADNTDMDLWVTDPSGETAIYSHPRTKAGGHMSRDFTGGYGPEAFTVRRPLPGTYIVRANYYGSRAQNLTGDVTVQLEFLTNFDGANGKREAVTRRLENRTQVIEVGRFVVGAEGK